MGHIEVLEPVLWSIWGQLCLVGFSFNIYKMESGDLKKNAVCIFTIKRKYNKVLYC